MIKELRVDENTDLNNIKAVNGLVLGNEGCIYKIIDEKIVKMAQKGAEMGMSVRLLTPFVPNKFIEKAYEQIEKLSSLCNLKVAFNDYGLLHRCYELINRGRIVPVCGRILSRSILDCPWYDELLNHEHDELKSAVIGPNYSHSSKWDILKKYNINEIELNSLEEKYMDELKKSKIYLTCHTDSNIISVGRVCFAARWYNLKLPECSRSSECTEKIDINLDKKWGKMKLMYEEVDNSVKQYFNGMYLQGNIVYKASNEVIDYAKTQVDSIII